MDEYKQEANFKRLLGKLTLADVWTAVERAERIMKKNKETGYPLQQYYGYEFYKVNPSLSVWEIVKQILDECRVLRNLE